MDTERERRGPASPAPRSPHSSALDREVETKIARAEVVSFDVFDTLLVRPFARPTDLFEHVADEVAELLGWTFVDFRHERTEAEREASAAAEKSGRGETTFDAIYDVLADRLRLTPEQRAAVMALELRAEHRLLRPRPVGARAYATARRLGKRIVVVSDMYLPASAIDAALRAHGFDAHERLYVSSEIGHRKHTGHLFDHVLRDLAVPPSAVVHLGDNALGDVRRPGERGIATVHLPRSEASFSASPAFRHVWELDKQHHSYAWGSVLATVAHELADVPDDALASRTLFAGDAFRLGFYGFGPLVLGFTKWVAEEAIRQGYGELFFLARDGKIFHEAYRRVSRCYPEAPPAKYLLCSRRALHVASIRTEADVHERMRKRFRKTTVGELLAARLGLPVSAVPEEIFRRHRLAPSDVIDLPDAPKLYALVPDIAPLVIARAAEEREAYLAYLDQMGFTTDRRPAVVDIGYAGTLQASLDSLLGGRTRIGGLYLISFRAARKSLLGKGMDAHGYLGSYVDHLDSNHAFVRHIPLYETLCSSAETSFVRMDRDPGGRLVPVYLPEDPLERRRVDVVSEIQRGALAFVEKFCDAWGEELARIDVEPTKTLRTLSAYFTDPSADDARILQGVYFENAYVGDDPRPLIPDGDDLRTAPCVWGQGRMAIVDGKTTTVRGFVNLREIEPLAPLVTAAGYVAGPLVVRAVDYFAPRFLPSWKAAKFHRDPAQFFADASNPAAHALARVYIRQRGGRRNGVK